MTRAIRADVRTTLRSLRRAPAFFIGTTAILAIGIGTAAAMFTVYKTVLVDRLPVTAQDRLVVMHPLDRRGTHLDVPFSYLAVIARDSAVFRGVAGVYHRGAQPLPFRIGNTSIRLGAATATTNYFDVVGVRPALGRVFREEDGQPGAPPVIVLSYAAWQHEFGGDSAVIGRTLVFPYTEQRADIVGVAPAGFEYPAGTDAWYPVPADASTQQVQADVIARLAPSVTLKVGRDALFTLTQRVNPFADVRQDVTVSNVAAQSFADTVLGASRPALAALILAVGLLLLIACVNVGNLVLVRSSGRMREIAVRRAIGASYIDLVRLFTIENVVLAIVGGVLGTVTSFVLVRVVVVFAPAQLARRDVLATVGPPLGVAAAISLAALLIFGLVPSLIAPRVNLLTNLRADSRSGTEGRSRRRARRWLVTTQMALAVVLLAGAGLLVRTLVNLQSMNLGYRAEHLSLLWFAGPLTDFSTPQHVFDTGNALVERLKAVPGVEAATPIENLPFEGQSLFIMKLAPAETPAPERGEYPFVPFEFGSADYFRTFAIPIRRGRGFVASDTKTSDRVVVVSETLARQLWPTEDALGKRLVNVADNSEWTVVGVAADTHFRELRRSAPVAYFNWEQITPVWSGIVAVRTAPPLPSMMTALRAATRDANPDMTLWDAKSMDDLLGAPLSQPRLSALLLASFSVAALLLSAIGLYGVMSAAVRQQTRDIGVRVALGASPAVVRRWVLSDALRIVGVGAATGIAGALVATRLLVSQLFGVHPLDPASLATATVILMLIGIGAAYVPARRAARIDPVEALRSE